MRKADPIAPTQCLVARWGLVPKGLLELFALSCQAQMDKPMRHSFKNCKRWCPTQERWLPKSGLHHKRSHWDRLLHPWRQRNRLMGISTGHILHKQWYSNSANALVASIPLRVDDEIVAVLSLRHTPGKSFTLEQLEKVREVSSPLIPGAMLLDRPDRNLVDHAKTAIAEWIARSLRHLLFVRRIVSHGYVARHLFKIFLTVSIMKGSGRLLTLPSVFVFRNDP